MAFQKQALPEATAISRYDTANKHRIYTFPAVQHNLKLCEFWCLSLREVVRVLEVTASLGFLWLTVPRCSCSTSNMSSIRRVIPLLNRVLVEKMIAPTKTPGGIMLPETASKKVRLLACVL